MSKHYALSTIKHGGRLYFRGDELPGLTADQVAALGLAVSPEPPKETGEEPVAEAAPPVPVPTPEPDTTDDPDGVAISDPDTGEEEPVAAPPKKSRGRKL